MRRVEPQASFLWRIEIGQTLYNIAKISNDRLGMQ